MLSKRLEALSKDPSNPDSIAELVVTALGPQGSFYICWKTVSGRYEQDSHGLPAALRAWLFPADGSRRDFETLQVILGPREGEFFASDRDGKRDQKPTETPSPQPGRLKRASTLWAPRDPATAAAAKRLSFLEEQPPEQQQQHHQNGPEPPVRLNRASTFWQREPPAAAANKRLSFVEDASAETKSSRRRSATLSSLGWTSSSRRTLSLPKVPIDPAEPEDQRRARRRTTLLPLALQAGPSPAAFGHGNVGGGSGEATAAPVGANPSRRSGSPPSRGPSRTGSLRRSPSNHSLNSAASREGGSGGHFSPERRRARVSIPEEPPTPVPAKTARPTSVYADACMQTDPPAADEPAAAAVLSDYYDGDFDEVRRRRARGMSTASDVSTVFSAAAATTTTTSETSSRRTSMESEDIKMEAAAGAVPACWLRQQAMLQQQVEQQRRQLEQLMQQQQEQQMKMQMQMQIQQQQEQEPVVHMAAAPNPVAMGRMQDYFRSSAYCLGDAFAPALGSGTYWGSWRQ